MNFLQTDIVNSDNIYLRSQSFCSKEFPKFPGKQHWRRPFVILKDSITGIFRESADSARNVQHKIVRKNDAKFTKHLCQSDFFVKVRPQLH